MSENMVPKPGWVRVLRYCAKGTDPVRRVLEWSETGLPIVESACDGNDGRWELVSGDQWEPAPPPAAQATQGELEAARERVRIAENERDAALRDAAEQRQRAEKAETECVRLNAATITASAPMCDQPHAADLAAKMLEAVKANARTLAAGGTLAEASRAWLAAMGEATPPTPAPAQGEPARPQLTAEDRAWMDACQEFQARWSSQETLTEKSKARSSRRKRKGGGK